MYISEAVRSSGRRRSKVDCKRMHGSDFNSMRERRHCDIDGGVQLTPVMSSRDAPGYSLVVCYVRRQLR